MIYTRVTKRPGIGRSVCACRWRAWRASLLSSTAASTASCVAVILSPSGYETSATASKRTARYRYRRTKNLCAVQLLLGHSKLESTVRYLGIEVDDALEIAEQTEI